MAAVIGMDAQPLQEVCQEATQRALAALPAAPTHPGQGQVVVANYNAPGQIVISGEQHALTLATELARARGAKRVIPLSVSGAFHSPVMQPAAINLARSIETADIRDASIPIIANITAQPLTQAQELRVELAQQVATSVQWTRTIEYLTSVGITTFIEIGPGQALTGMIKRIAKGSTTINVGNVAEVEKAAASIRDMNLI
jgi:[acyl-carrier-protein] S-malonyltransferase